MIILAIESSGNVASTGIFRDGVIVGEYTLNNKKTHSQVLLPMVDEVLKATDVAVADVDAIAVSAGPGSFTGLRIGAATAKGLALATNKPIVPVPTVDGLAFNLRGVDGLIVPVMDARRNQTYTGIYRCKDELVIEREQCAVSIDEIVDDINDRGEAVSFLGDGVPVFRDYIEENVTVPYSFASAHMSLQRAGSLACLGAWHYDKGNVVDADDFRIDYLRMSQAERERYERLAREVIEAG